MGRTIEKDQKKLEAVVDFMKRKNLAAQGKKIN
jgi:hypothetical protein